MTYALAQDPQYEELMTADMQENDWTVDGAMTDPKGDRSLSPSKQADPDLFLHVVEKRKDGIVVGSRDESMLA